MKRRIYLFRHGETEWSASGRHTGSTDLPLTPEGQRVAMGLRRRLGEVRFSRILTSPLQRARQTCSALEMGVPTSIDPDLREWNYGDYEGKTTPEIRASAPGWNLFADGCPNGETVSAITTRADRVLARVVGMEGDIALFSHGHFLRALAARWMGLPVGHGRHLGLNTGAICELGLEHDDENDRVIWRWNVGHLGLT